MQILQQKVYVYVYVFGGTRYNVRLWLDEDNLLHRDDGPAVEWPDGDKAYFIHGKFIRKDVQSSSGFSFRPHALHTVYINHKGFFHFQEV